MPGSPPGELLDQRVPALDRAASAAGRRGPCRPGAPPRPRRSARVQSSWARCMPSSPSASRRRSESSRELLGGVVALHPRHHLDRVDEQVARTARPRRSSTSRMRVEPSRGARCRGAAARRSARGGGAPPGAGSSPSRTSVLPISSSGKPIPRSARIRYRRRDGPRRCRAGIPRPSAQDGTSRPISS